MSCPRTAFKLPARCPSPAQVMSDQGSQLTTFDNSIKFDSLNWEQVELPRSYEELPTRCLQTARALSKPCPGDE